MLYHVQVCLPDRIRALVPKGTIPLTMTRHAQTRATENGISIPAYLDMGKTSLVEVDDSPLKFVVRLDNGRAHTVLAIVRDGKQWIVKTTWENKRNDNHRTLDTRRYYKGV